MSWVFPPTTPESDCVRSIVVLPVHLYRVQDLHESEALWSTSGVLFLHSYLSTVEIQQSFTFRRGLLSIRKFLLCKSKNTF